MGGKKGRLEVREGVLVDRMGRQGRRVGNMRGKVRRQGGMAETGRKGWERVIAGGKAGRKIWEEESFEMQGKRLGGKKGAFEGRQKVTVAPTQILNEHHYE